MDRFNEGIIIITSPAPSGTSRNGCSGSKCQGQAVCTGAHDDDRGDEDCPGTDKEDGGVRVPVGIGTQSWFGESSRLRESFQKVFHRPWRCFALYGRRYTDEVLSELWRSGRPRRCLLRSLRHQHVSAGTADIAFIPAPEEVPGSGTDRVHRRDHRPHAGHVEPAAFALERRPATPIRTEPLTAPMRRATAPDRSPGSTTAIPIPSSSA